MVRVLGVCVLLIVALSVEVGEVPLQVETLSTSRLRELEIDAAIIDEWTDQWFQECKRPNAMITDDCAPDKILAFDIYLRDLILERTPVRSERASVLVHGLLKRLPTPELPKQLVKDPPGKIPSAG